MYVCMYVCLYILPLITADFRFRANATTLPTPLRAAGIFHALPPPYFGLFNALNLNII